MDAFKKLQDPKQFNNFFTTLILKMMHKARCSETSVNSYQITSVICHKKLINSTHLFKKNLHTSNINHQIFLQQEKYYKHTIIKTLFIYLLTYLLNYSMEQSPS